VAKDLLDTTSRLDPSKLRALLDDSTSDADPA
jgi:hypothetical protein